MTERRIAGTLEGTSNKIKSSSAFTGLEGRARECFGFIIRSEKFEKKAKFSLIIETKHNFLCDVNAEEEELTIKV